MLGPSVFPSTPILTPTTSQVNGTGGQASVTLTPDPGRSIVLAQVRGSVLGGTMDTIASANLTIAWPGGVESYSRVIAPGDRINGGAFALSFTPPLRFPAGASVNVHLEPMPFDFGTTTTVYVTAWEV